MTAPEYDPPSKLLLMLEPRALFELGSCLPARFLLDVPKGDGHPVIIYPGFMASDISTGLLRRFLRDHHYEALPWKLGRNLGYSPALEGLMQEHLQAMADYHGRKVSLVGWSLGGVYARELARAMPDQVRQVITMGSPFSGQGKATNVTWLYDMVSGEKLRDMDPGLLDRLREPLPVPSTAIYSKSDGVVAWQTCREPEPGEFHQNIRVPGSHFGLGVNPIVLNVLGDRLAQPEGAWAPFRPRGWERAFYPPEPSSTQREETPSRWQEVCARLDALSEKLAG